MILPFRKWITTLAIAAAVFMPSLVTAQETQIKRAVESRFGVKVEGVRKAPFLGLYEVVIAGDEREIAYTDDKGSHLFSGNVFELSSRRNLTQERLNVLNAINFDELPLDLAIKQVRGNGRRVVAVFSDPFCGFCRQLDQNLSRLDNITVYTFLYPILRKDESPEMAGRIWCSPDRAKAYLDLMLRNREPAKVAACNVPLERWLALGQKLGVSATPVSYVRSGARIIGARFDEVQRAMDEPPRTP